MNKPHSITHITRMDVEKHAFDGWRVCRQKDKVQYHCYVSDRKAHTRSETPWVHSLRKAKRILKELNQALETSRPAGIKRWCKQNHITVTQK